MTDSKQIQDRRLLDIELGEIQIAAAQIEDATDPHSFSKSLKRIENARRDSEAVGINSTPAVTQERINKAKELLLAVMSKGPKKSKTKDVLDAFSYQYPVPQEITPGDSDLVIEPVTSDEAKSIEDIFGSLSIEEAAPTEDDSFNDMDLGGLYQ